MTRTVLRRLYAQLAGPGFAAAVVRIAAGSAATQAVSMALALVVGILLARALGPGGLGIYTLAMSVVAALSIPTEFGLPTYAMREAAAGHVRGDWAYVVSVVAWCSRRVLLLSLAVVGVAASVISVWPGQLSSALQWTLYAALPMVALVSFTKIFEAALRGMDFQVVGQLPMLILRPGLFLAGLAIAGALGLALTASSAMVVHSAAMVLVAASITWLLRSRMPHAVRNLPRQPFDGAPALRAALPMALTEGLRVLNGHLSVFLVGVFATADAVGIYKVADSVGLLCGLPLSVLNVVAASQIARLHAGGEATRLRRLVSYVALGMVGGSVMLAVPTILFGHGLLALLFGPEFVEAFWPMVILCVGYAAAAYVGPAVVFMNMTGRERTVTQGISLSFTLNLALGAIGVSFAGPVGAAFANVAGNLAWNVWLWREAKRQAGVDTSLVPAMRELLAR